MGLRNAAEVYSKPCKSQTKGKRYLKYGFKWLMGRLLIDLGGNMLTSPKILVWGACNFEKMQKTGFLNVADVYLKFCKLKT